MSATLVTPKTTSGGEIITHLINATDGEGLHFDGAAGTVANVASPDLGTKFSVELILQFDRLTNESFLVDFTLTGRWLFELNGSDQFNIYDGANRTFSPATVPELGKPMHIVCVQDGTSATLYRDGNQIATATTGAITVDNCSKLNLGNYVTPGVNYGFDGTMYRARLWNKALTQAEVTASYENATVPFADQYGSQTSLVDAAASVFTSGTYSWAVDGSNTIGNVGSQLVITYVDDARGAYNYLKNASDLTADLTVGKRYRIEFDAKVTGDIGATMGVSSVSDSTGPVTLTGSLVSYSINFTASSATGGYFHTADMASGNTVVVDNWYVREIGCVADYDLAFANPTQSTMVQDRAGAADGTASSGVTQVTPIVQVNATAARIGTSAATPADGDLAVSGKVAVTGVGVLLDGATSQYVGSSETYDLRLLGAVSTGGAGAGVNVEYYNASSWLKAIDIDNVSSGYSDLKLMQDGGKVLVGGTTASGAFGTHAWAPALQQLGSQGILSVRTETSEWGGSLHLASSNGTAASPTAAADDDAAGAVYFEAYDGTDFRNYVGGIECQLDGAVASNDTPGRLVFSTAADGANTLTERLRIDSTGLATFSNGINLGDSNLSNYEEGTFGTASANGILNAATGSITCGTNYNCSYTRIGNLVHFQGLVRVSAVSTPSGVLNIVLPFTCATGYQNNSYFSIYTDLIDWTADYLVGQVNNGSAAAYLKEVTDDSAQSNVDASGVTALDYIGFGGTYITDE